MLFVSTALSGWAAALLLGVSIGIPYLARNLRWPSLAPHFVLGFLIPAVSSVHAWLPMAALRRFDSRGLVLASVALLVMVFQVCLGVALRKATGAERRRIRWIHLAGMAIIIVLVGEHVALSRG